MRLHHVGVATDDLDGLLTLYGDLLGAELAHRERFQGMDVAFLDAAGTGATGTGADRGGTGGGHADGHGDGGDDHHGDGGDHGGPYLELLDPVEEEGAIARYLDREGPGLHHVAAGVDDVGAALDRAREMGVEPVDEEPRPGAWGHEVAFLHPDDTGGVLVEFVGTGH